MKYGIKTLDDFDVQGKTVLCRVDVNQPVDKQTGELKDTTRIEGCVPTLRELSDKGAKVVVLAHQGGDLEYKNFYTTQPHSKVLSKLLDRNVEYIDDVCGPYARERIKAMQPGDILMLDNVRIMGEELTLFETKLRLTHEEQAKTTVVRKLAPLADLYVCDAFAASHRDQPTLCGFEYLLPSAMGRLFEKEYEIISTIMSVPERPCMFVLGGAKIEDAFLMMETVLANDSADMILTGGLVGNVMLAACGVDIGKASMAFLGKKNLLELLPEAKRLCQTYRDKLVLPVDLACVTDGKRKDVPLSGVSDGEVYIDIGKETAAKYSETLNYAQTVFINGPMGVFEDRESELGTRAVWEAIAHSDAYSVVGGGDSVTATKKFGLKDEMSYICTGGGALVRFLSNEELPVIRALKHGSKL